MTARLRGGMDDPQAMRIMMLQARLGRRINEILMLDADPLLPLAPEPTLPAPSPIVTLGRTATQRSLRRMRQVLSWAFARSPGERSFAWAQLASASGDRRPADVALLSAVSMCFALGAGTTGQFKHLAAADAGPLAGLGALALLGRGLGHAGVVLGRARQASRAGQMRARGAAASRSASIPSASAFSFPAATSSPRLYAS